MTHSSQRSAGLKHGWHSGLEEQVMKQLHALDVPYAYEPLALPFVQPARTRRYTPDFILPNGIVIETKGRFVTADRQKHLLILQQYPALDLRFVFSRSSTRISKQSRTTYAAWCDDHGFLYADRTIPIHWITATPNAASLRVIRSLTEG